MFEEPYRWMEAISTRHNYVQEKLKMGQPVIAVPYNEGLLVFGFAPQPGKIYEIYDRIALGTEQGKPNFFRMNYDGHWETFKNGTAIAGDETVMDWLQREIQKQPFASYSLDQALQEATKLWDESRKLKSENSEDQKDNDLPETLQEAFNQWHLEGAVLTEKSTSKAIYRPLSEDEIHRLKSSTG